MLPENITCAFKNKASFIKLEIKSECSYYLEVRKKNAKPCQVNWGIARTKTCGSTFIGKDKILQR